MKKNSFLLLLALYSITSFSQDLDVLPSEFSWDNVCTTNGLRNYVNEAVDQNYQGPCLGFAFTAAIETTYGIENDVHEPDLFTLSSAYLDYRVWDAGSYIEILDMGFKTPLSYPEDEINTQAPESCQVGDPDIDADCFIERSDVMEYINHPDGQRSYRLVAIEGGSSDDTEWSVEDGGPLGDSIRVGETLELCKEDFGSNDDIKYHILNNGPIILKVSGYQKNGSHNAKLFRDYNIHKNLTYHAFTIIGWTSDSEWIVKDSWPGMAAITTTHPNINIYDMMVHNVCDPDPDEENNLGNIKVQLYQVSNIFYNKTKPAQNPVILDLDGCQPPPPALELSNINIEVDYAHIGGYLYHKVWVYSNVDVDNWVWGIAYPNGAMRRSQINNPTYSSVLLSPITSGLVTIYVRAYKDGETLTTERIIHLSNGQSSGGDDEGGNGW